MNFNEFIFSDQLKYRVRRHLIFWMAWCLYFAITFLVPTYWVPAWNLKGPMPQIEKYGVGVSILRILMNSVLMTVVHMIPGVWNTLLFSTKVYHAQQKSTDSPYRFAVSVCNCQLPALIT